MKEFSAGVHALVFKNNEYLFLKRHIDDKYDPGCWDLPGGGINFNEQPLEAVIREVKEEVGIHIKPGKVLNVFGIPSEGGWSIEIYIEGKYLRGKIKLSSEHSNFIWVKKDEIKLLKPKSIHFKNIELFI